MDSNTKTALEIFSYLIRGIKVNNKNNKDLYRALLTNSIVNEELHEIVNMHDLELYVTDREGAFVIAKANNKVFGYTNDELRNKLGIKSNKELYLGYFIIYSIISSFYIQSNYKTQVEYITSMSLLNTVEKKLAAISSNDSLIETNEDHTFKAMYNYWSTELIESNNKNKETVDFNEKRGKTRLSLINRILFFLVENEYMDKDEFTNRYSITSKFESIIERFFDDAETKTVLQKLLDEEIENSKGEL
ncbi:MAG: hypothetical protein E7214_03275 [Clostridium sp.]|nr:hypothetical protein [Clostridium sp.]